MHEHEPPAPRFRGLRAAAVVMLLAAMYNLGTTLRRQALFDGAFSIGLAEELAQPSEGDGEAAGLR